MKLPTSEELMAIDDVVFPEEVKLTNDIDDIINQARVTIPGSIILHQFEMEGSYSNTKRFVLLQSCTLFHLYKEKEFQ